MCFKCLCITCVLLLMCSLSVCASFDVGKHFNDAYFESAELRRAEEQLLSTDRQALTHTPPPHHNDKDKQHRDAEDWGAQVGLFGGGRRREQDH